MSFQIGEKVVYPTYGVGTIENISSRLFGSQFERFYLLKLATNAITVMVPFSHVGDIGLRKVTKNGEVGRMLLFLACGTCKCSQDWKNRFKENSDRMRSGSLLEVAEVLKSLLLLQMEKPLSFREKKMLDCARQMLISEVSISRALREGDAIQLMQRSLEKSALTFPPPL